MTPEVVVQLFLGLALSVHTAILLKMHSAFTSLTTVMMKEHQEIIFALDRLCSRADLDETSRKTAQLILESKYKQENKDDK